ncbi:MAG: gamma-glutamyltransferase [Crocinitomicaceae bacterium]|nr:gamma-glutamyltransferase [Crocinitomicaceae bacterium]
MVVSAHPLASEIGKSILLKGGNAVDAAIAVQFALTVVHPSAGNIGGGGFMVVRFNDGSHTSLDFRETAPALASKDMYLDDKGNVIDRLSLDGHLAVGVPGTVDGMYSAFKKYGTLKWEELLQPSIDLANNGFVLTKLEAEGLNYYNSNKLKFNSISPTYLEGTWSQGDTLKLTDLGNTLALIRDYQRAGFYEGETAEKFIQEMNRNGGLITKNDLINYQSKWRDPVVGMYKNFKVISMGPPSSGGACLLQILKMIESFNLKKMGFHSADAVHLIVEAEKRAFADRSKYLGDPDFIRIPLEKLLDSNYLIDRMRNYSSLRATISDSIYPGDFDFVESDQTTHYSIVDAYGNAASVTTTLNSSYGSGVVVGGAGFLLNNEMDDFSSKPGAPNLYGLVGGSANAIEPNKRMLSSMTPTILEKDKKLFMVVGTPGGSTIITGVLQTILNVIEFDLSMQDAVSAGRFHHQWKPKEIKIEQNKFDSTLIFQLMQMGHSFNFVGSMNRVDAIVVAKDGSLEPGADPRGDDAYSGF